MAREIALATAFSVLAFVPARAQETGINGLVVTQLSASAAI
jgi:hypothetical protein